MPSPRAFLRAFDLNKNTVQFPGLRVLKVKIGHNVLKRYQQYEFPLEVWIDTELNPQEALDLVKTLTKEHRTVLSDYGNPYDCFITDVRLEPDAEEQYHISATGYGNRIR